MVYFCVKGGEGLKKEYAILKIVQRDTGLINRIAGAAILFLAVCVFWYGGWKVFPETQPVYSLYTASPEELEGKKICTDITFVSAEYLRYKSWFGNDCVEIIIPAGENTFCAVRVGKEKMLKVHLALKKDGFLDEKINIFGRMQDMDDVSEVYYRRYIGNALGVEKLPEEFKTYVIMDETTEAPDMKKAYTSLAFSALLLVAGTIILVRGFDFTTVKQIKKLIDRSENPEATQYKLLEFWGTTPTLYNLRITADYVAWTGILRAHIIDRREFSSYELSEDGKKIIFTSESRKRYIPIQDFAADILMEKLKGK
ncbi:MAG: hypothetical protein IKC06_08535 [Clostridia bacterium]|nr:hypothetical protein [Clostridia bacterium]